MNSRVARGLVLGVAAMTVLVPSSGCSLLAPTRNTVIVTASDPTAEIWVDGALLGRGTVHADLSCNRNHAVMARMGERVGSRTINRKVSVTGVLDLIGGCFFLIPFIGLFGPGFFELEEESILITVPLDPGRSPSTQ